MLFPFARKSATTWRISSIVATDCMLETVLCIRIGAAPNILRPRSKGRANFLRHLRVALEKFRLTAVVEPKHVRKNKNLPVTVRAGANSNCGNSDSGCDAFGDRCRYELQHDRKRSSFFQSLCLGDQALRTFRFTSLDPRATNRIYRLWSEPDMRHHRNAGADQSVNRVEHLRASAFDLHRSDSGLLYRASAI